jgi:hypothetical protein
MILYGGQIGTTPELSNGVDAYGFGTDTWQPLLNPSPPVARYGEFGAFDDTRRRLVIYGGSYFDVDANHNVWLDDTWAYDAVAGTWQQLAGAGSLGNRIDVLGIYDPVRDRLIAFGGQDSLAEHNDLHALAFLGSGTWAPLAPAGAPPPVGAAFAAAYDPDGDRMIVFGNAASGVATWQLSLADPVTWSQLSPNGRVPFARFDLLALYDAKHRRILLHGGDSSLDELDDTWAFVLDETTPTLLSLVDADVSASLVRIRWYSGETLPGPATVLRRVDGGEFVTVGQVVQDGTGMLTYEDRDLAGGRRFDYKLSVRGQEFGAVSATIPGSPALRLLGPNPSFGDLQVAFELVGGAPARLELYDVTGRRVRERGLDGLAAGAHVLTLARPAPGMYFLRLVQAGHSIVRKVAIAG